MFAAFTSQRCRIVLALLIATRISIFAYSSAATNTPMSSSVFKTLLSNSNNNHRGAAEKRRTTAASATQLELLAPANAASAASNASSSAPAAAAAAAPLLRDRLRSRLFRRRASDNGDAGSATTATTTPTSSSALPMLDVLRGGAAEAAVGRNILVAIFCRFANFIGQTKTRCFLLLMLSVFIESYATTLSKQAKDTGNALLFVRACFVYLMCMVGFNVSLAQLDVSVAYAVWSALGTTLVTAVGFFFFGESLDMAKILYLCMIVGGVIGLNMRG